MKITDTGIDGLFVLEPKVIGDARGWFCETFRADELEQKVGHKIDFVQDNHSFSAAKGILRGIHFQNFPYSQTKLVRCTRGSVLDVAVDLRPASRTYKKWFSVELSAENKRQLFIPRGFGHGFLTLTENVEIQYKADDFYNNRADRSIKFDDPAFKIKWGVETPIMSEKDKTAPLLKSGDVNFGARVLVTGAAGPLGFDMVKLLKDKGIECVGADRNDFDITDAKAVEKFFKKYKPTAVIHCAAYTAVDKAEDEREICHAVNVVGTKNVAAAAAKQGASVVYISSDYVYGAEGERPQVETDETRPLNYYAETKLQGEKCVKDATNRHFILRTSWVFGKNGANFVKTMLRLAIERTEVSVVDDQIGSPTYTPDLAKFILGLVFTENFGVYNISNEGFTSWADFAIEIFKQAGLKTKVNKIKTSDYKTKARRQGNSRLDKTKAGVILPTWQDALKRYLEEIK
jgi:dTDP-4-dehydrorhamnose reductase/dTDP-4-dehydrorhamnose 3,5-epimerase